MTDAETKISVQNKEQSPESNKKEKARFNSDQRHKNNGSEKSVWVSKENFVKQVFESFCAHTESQEVTTWLVTQTFPQVTTTIIVALNKRKDSKT